MSLALVRTLDTEINNALGQPDVRARLANLAFEPSTSSQRQFARFVTGEMAKWEQIVKKTDITLR